ncbi:MAG: hypothetical protein HRT43_14920 [Campylobacteraceae bacterium]|nr:hypothetical protein [Campylobacteraceae bacterium]
MFYDIIGIFGVALILIVYAMVQTDKLSVNNIYYSICNAVGAFFIIISLMVDFNLPAFLMEFFWVIFSLFGIYKSLKAKKINAKNK